ncbi:hypothetical protein [Methylocystis sp. JR02]|uniref:hypothetical protein n=1 Tax=Methylocystis sp. JR02 TaxID=3046284 RepID=UPI0024B94213|nr:hypothetical protein [Methylocystis sp. JR02]MDJ0449218.1 hypothetical protein [Methylocystis sp. JR02]
MSQQQLDERDRRWAYELLSAGFSPEEAARLIERPLEFIVGEPPAPNETAMRVDVHLLVVSALGAFRAQFPRLFQGSGCQ